jgi:hypothetical protein
MFIDFGLYTGTPAINPPIAALGAYFQVASYMMESTRHNITFRTPCLKLLLFKYRPLLLSKTDRLVFTAIDNYVTFDTG